MVKNDEAWTQGEGYAHHRPRGRRPSDMLAEAITLRERLDAKIAGAFAEFEDAGLWLGSGATSATAWLRSHCLMTARSAGRLSSQARRLARLPVCAAAAVDGTLTGGQVEAIVAVVDDALTPLFAEHEAELVPRLAQLTVKGVARAMAVWKARVAAEGTEPADAEHSLHLSATPGRASS